MTELPEVKMTSLIALMCLVLLADQMGELAFTDAAILMSPVFLGLVDASTASGKELLLAALAFVTSAGPKRA